MWLLAEQVFYDLLDARHTRLAADQHDLINVLGLYACIFQSLPGRLDRTLDDVFDHLLQLGPGEFLYQVLGAGGIGGDEGQVDLGFHGGGKLDLGLFRCVTQTLQGHFVALAAQVQSFFLLEFVYQPFHNALVNVVAAEVGISVGGLHLDHAFAYFQNGNIEGAAAEVIHGDGFILLLVQTVSQRGRGRFIDDALHVQARNLACVFGGLALRVIEICRDGNHRLSDCLPQIVLSRFLQLLQNHGRNLWWSVFLVLRHNRHMVALADYLVGDHLHFVVDFFVTTSHESLDGVNGVFRVGNRLALCHLANQSLAGFGERYHRWSGAAAFFILNDFGLSAFHYGHH